MNGSEPSVALVFSPEVWVEELHRHLSHHGGARVRQIVQEGLSVYRIKTDVLQSLQPDLIVTQDQCDVCAVSLPEVEEAVRIRTGERGAEAL